MAKPNQSEDERQAQKTKFVEYFLDVPVVKYASMYVGITEQTAHNWLREDPVFFSQVNEAKASWAKKRALKTKAEFQLERLDKDIWAERKEIKVEGDPVKELLEGFGLKTNDAGQTESTEETTSSDNS